MLRAVISNDGYVLCTLLSLSLVLVVKILNSKRMMDFLRFLGNSNYLRIYIKEHSFFDRFDSLLFFNFCLNGTAFGYIIYAAFVDQIEINITTFLISFGLIAFWVLLKTGIQLLIGYVFDFYKYINILKFQQISSLNFVGIMLLPMNAVLVFQLNFDAYAVLLSGIILLTVIGFGMIKTIQSNLKLVLSNFFYFILYICTLEFGPWILTYGLLGSNNSL